MLHFDVIIIGGGVAGMTSALYLKRAGLNVLLMEGEVIGGQLNRISNIENYPGFMEVDGPTLSCNIFSQLQKLDMQFAFEKVTRVDLKGKQIFTKRNIYTYDNLIIATGRRPRSLEVEGSRELENAGISYCALCDGALYKNRNVVVVGGARSALEEALYLAKIAKNVTIVCRGDKIKAEKVELSKIKKVKNIKIIHKANIVKYNLKDDKIEGVLLDNHKKVKAEGIFVAIGSIPNSDLFDVRKEDDYIIVDKNQKTSKKNVYAIGDVTKKEIYQIVTACNEGIKAANNIIKETY